jgi:hypothetical protein
VAFGSSEANAFIGTDFRREAPGYHVSWVVENHASIYEVLPQASDIRISAHFQNPRRSARTDFCS